MTYPEESRHIGEDLGHYAAAITGGILPGVVVAAIVTSGLADQRQAVGQQMISVQAQIDGFDSLRNDMQLQADLDAINGRMDSSQTQLATLHREDTQLGHQLSHEFVG